MITISFDWDSYLQHKLALDEIAISLQKNGSRVGIITGEREKHSDRMGRQVIDKKKIILESLGFTPDFLHLWGETETIGDGALWKAMKMDDENITLHFDDDATDIKRKTERWVAKLLLNGQEAKF